MRPLRALGMLVVPFAILSMALLGGMCLTPYWECRVLEPLSSAWLAPILFTFALFVSGAAVVLYADLVLIARLSMVGKSRLMVVAVAGGVIAAVPWTVLHALGGQGVGALNPQLEYLPFLVSGGVFGILLDSVVASQHASRKVSDDA
jgi:hypothetical protein